MNLRIYVFNRNMLTKKEFLDTGLIEIYCLGHASEEETRLVQEYITAYPEIQAEIEATHLALDKYVHSFSVPLPASLKDQIWDILENDIDDINIENPPLLGHNHDFAKWKEATKDIDIPEVEDNVYMHTLRSDEKVEIFLVRLREYIPDEHHEDLHESFLILEGSCECIVEGKSVKMKEGDYIEMPLWAVHNITVTSDTPVIAVLQWLKAS